MPGINGPPPSAVSVATLKERRDLAMASTQLLRETVAIARAANDAFFEGYKEAWNEVIVGFTELTRAIVLFRRSLKPSTEEWTSISSAAQSTVDESLEGQERILGCLRRVEANLDTIQSLYE